MAQSSGKKSALIPLPIDDLLGAITQSIVKNHALIIQAPPGSGKTTRVPAALLDCPVLNGEIWVLEPRRLAAWLAARRVAEERGEPLGGTVGYHVRFEEQSSAKTRLRFLTEGVFNRWYLNNPELRGVAAVIVDEVHERSLHSDLALALLKRLQHEKRPDLKLIAMSATADARRLAGFLNGAEIINSSGSLYPVAVQYRGTSKKEPLARQVADGFSQVLADGQSGDIPVFLPGAYEIRAAFEACRPLADRQALAITPLHADLPAAERELAVFPGAARKLILSTNVAESSITIPGVQVVIDSGLQRRAAVSNWTGLTSTITDRISQASAAQRAGRAGRTGPGYCLRLYSQDDFAMRPAFSTPEIFSADLSEVVLFLAASGVSDPAALVWLEHPPKDRLAAAFNLLKRLAALDNDGALTALGRKMLDLPLHPRLAKVVLEAKEQGCAPAGCLAAAILNERDFRKEARVRLLESGRAGAKTHSDSDLIDLLETYETLEQGGFARKLIEDLAIDRAALERVRKLYERLCRAIKTGRPGTAGLGSGYAEALKKAILKAFPDRVARRVKAERGAPVQLNFSGDKGAVLSSASSVQAAEFLVALEAEEKVSAKGLSNRIMVHKASAIQADWLLEFFSEQIAEKRALDFDLQSKRVREISSLQYEGLSILESESKPADMEASAKLLFEQAKSSGFERFDEAGEQQSLLARLDFLRRKFPQLRLTAADEGLFEKVFQSLCYGAVSFRELKDRIGEGALRSTLLSSLAEDLRRALQELAPEYVRLPRRPKVPVHYEKDKDPWIESRIQDFFGLTKTPVLGKSSIPLVLHLLAPSQRAVQVTNDLPGFWTRHYPALRQQLSRRYPKHHWPENPAKQP